jgi:hypothetical protein
VVLARTRQRVKSSLQWLLCAVAAGAAGIASAELAVTEANAATFYRNFVRLTERPHPVAPLTAALCTIPSQAVVEREMQVSGPHYQTSVHLYASRSALPTIKSRARPFPAGAVIVKEKLASDGKVSGVGGMIKRRPGYDAANGDWEYFYFGGPGEFSSGRIESCVTCHRAAKSTDHVYSVWNHAR